MELLGLLFLTVGTVVLSVALAAVAAAIRPLRRFALIALAVPAISVPLAVFTWWSVHESGPVCEIDPEFHRCPTAAAILLAGICWFSATVAVGIVTYWIQRGIQATFDLGLSLFSDRPRWSR